MSQIEPSQDKVNVELKLVVTDSLTNSPQPLELGEHYELLDQIGEGGMGYVYRAKHKATDKIFAIKIMKAELAKDAASLKRFQKEVELVSHLEHPNLANTYESGTTSDGKPYIVMDLIDGSSLQDEIDNQRVHVDQFIETFLEVCDVLKHAHSKGVIHSDLKPNNIMLTKTGESSAFNVKLLDFGIAKLETEMQRRTINFTETAEVIGSPLYMSPEQCLGYLQDERSDIYSLGCVMYEFVSGKPPFKSKNPTHLIAQHLSSSAPSLSILQSSKLTKGIDAIIQKCMAKDPAMRYQSIADLMKELELLSNNKETLAEMERGPTFRLANDKRWLTVFITCISGFLLLLVAQTIGIELSKAAIMLVGLLAVLIPGSVASLVSCVYSFRSFKQLSLAAKLDLFAQISVCIASGLLFMLTVLGVVTALTPALAPYLTPVLLSALVGTMISVLVLVSLRFAWSRSIREKPKRFLPDDHASTLHRDS